MLMDELFTEADRQMKVCNSCRYCAGYCPVWPALELRTMLTTNDLTHLANLCHDCRDCFSACMYTAPHEFALNPPKVFAQIREQTYEEYAWPRAFARLARRPAWVIGAVLVASAVIVLLGGLVGSGRVFGSSHGGDPYSLIGHWSLVAVFASAGLFAAVSMAISAGRYWAAVHGRFVGLLDLRSWGRTLSDVARLRHYSGADEGCSYPEGEPSAQRKVFHQLVMYGFLLTFVSTTSAGVLQNFLGQDPPYDLVSVPVLTGIAGGVLAIVGCVGLLVLKRRADPVQTTGFTRSADESLLWALLVLMVTGILVLIFRSTVAFGPLLVVHLSLVLAAFLVAPYTKFVHWVYRLLSIHHDHQERDVGGPQRV